MRLISFTSFFRRNNILITLLIVAILFRFVGVNPGVYQYHPDEPIVYSTALDMVKNKSLNPIRFDYPGLSIYINYIFFQLVFIPLGWLMYFLQHIAEIVDGTIHIPIAPLEAHRTLQTFIFGIKDVNVLFWGRYIAASFSVGNVLLSYVLATKLFGKKAGLLAALFLTFNFRQVLNSHLNLPDIYNAFFLLLSLIASYAIWEKPSKFRYALAGIAAGLSFSTKYQVFALVALGVSHLILVLRNTKDVLKRLVEPNIFIVAIIFVMTFLVTNPYFLIDINTAIEWITVVSHKYGANINKLSFYPFWYLLHIDYGPPEFLLLIAGIIINLKLNLKKSIPLFVTIFLFFLSLIYWSRGGFYIRNFVTITPVIFVLASGGLAEILKHLEGVLKKQYMWGLYVLSGMVVLFIPAKNATVNTYYSTQPWNYNITSKWLFENIPSGTVIASNPFDPPTGSPELSKTEFESYGSYSLSEHKENGAEYAMINLEWAGNPFYSWMTFGIDDIGYVFRKPLKEMRNTFYGIAIEEGLRYQIFSITKPWQAPDANIVVSKLPKWPETKMLQAYKFGFDNDSEGWVVYGKSSRKDIATYNYDSNVGNTKNGSLSFNKGLAKYPTVRITSPALDVKSGRLYAISGMLKSGKKVDINKRDGFIRVDFYQNDPDFEDLGVITSVSSRYYGEGEWAKKEIIVRAPDDVRYATVSFQVNEILSAELWIDDVIVEESDDRIKDILKDAPYNYKPIDLNLIYPNSHGNF